MIIKNICAPYLKANQLQRPNESLKRSMELVRIRITWEEHNGGQKYNSNHNCKTGCAIHSCISIS